MISFSSVCGMHWAQRRGKLRPARLAGRSPIRICTTGGFPAQQAAPERKRRLLTALGLPPRLSKKELVEALNRLYTYQQLDELQARLLAEE